MKDNSLLKIFAVRMFRSVYFKLAILSSVAITILHVFQTFRPSLSYILYPNSLYNSWIGGEGISLSHTLAFQAIPVFSALSFSTSFAIDKKTGYIKQLLARKSKKQIFAAYYITAFWGGALTGVFPFVFNFMVSAALYPALPPQATTYSFLPFITGFLAELFYTIPLLYCLFYMFIIAIFSASIASFSVALGAFIENQYLVLASPFLLWIWLYYISNNFNVQAFNPYIMLAPIHSVSVNIFITLLYILILNSAAIIIFLTKAHKDDVF